MLVVLPSSHFEVNTNFLYFIIVKYEFTVCDVRNMMRFPVHVNTKVIEKKLQIVKNCYLI